MDFELSEEQRMLAESLGRWLERNYDLAAREAAQADPPGFPAALWDGLAELGAMAALLPEEAGGLGGGGFDIATVFEALGHALVAAPLCEGVLMPARALIAAGRADEAAPLAEGRGRLAFVHDDPGAQYERSRIATRAERVDGGWRLAGRKAPARWVEGAEALLVTARSAGEEDAREGISLFRVPAGAPGLELRACRTIDGARAAEVILDGVTLGAEALIGEAGGGAALIDAAFDAGMVAVMAEALGIMERIKALTLEYLRTRRQFGRPIGSFQALQHRMATVLLEIEQARSAVIDAADALGRGEPRRSRTLAASKYAIGRIGRLVAEEAIQMHGGIGMTWEYPLGHYAKRLVTIDHQFADEDAALARYIALSAAEADAA